MVNGVSFMGPILVSGTISALYDPQGLLIPQILPSFLGLVRPREALLLLGHSAVLSRQDAAWLQFECHRLGIRAESMSTVSAK